MISNFLVLVEDFSGRFIRAFTYRGRLDEALQVGRERAYEMNNLDVHVSASPIANN